MRRSGPSFVYTARAMKVLLHQPEITITNLAMLSRINHQRCRELIRVLETQDYLITRLDGRRQYVTLTAAGRSFGTKLLALTHESVERNDILASIVIARA